MEYSDHDLMARIKNGSQEAFADLVRRHQDSLVNFFRRLGAITTAEDLAQETFLRLFKYRKKYRPDAKFTTFLYTLARHAWADSMRKAKRGETLATRLADGQDGSPDAAPPDSHAQIDANTAMALLPEKLRVVVVMSIYQGLRYEDIADALDVPVGTVKSRMFLAIRRLQEKFNVKT